MMFLNISEIGSTYGEMFSNVTNGVTESVVSTVAPLISELSDGAGNLYHSLIKMAAENELGRSIIEIVAENKLSAALSLTCLVLIATVGFYHLRLTQVTAKLQDNSLSLNANLPGKPTLADAINPADLEKRDEHGRTPLLLAVDEGNSKKVKKLLAAGADYNVRDDFQGSPLSYAAQLGHTKIVQLLCHYKANMEMVDEFGNTPLLLAARNGHREIVEILLQKGACLAAKNKAKLIAADLAEQNGYQQTTDILVEKANKLHNNPKLLEKSQMVMTLREAMATDNVEGVKHYLETRKNQGSIKEIKLALLKAATEKNLKNILSYLS